MSRWVPSWLQQNSSMISRRLQSLIAQGTSFPLRKPPGFHWDFLLLGITTFIAGLLGVPAPNGLIPQVKCCANRRTPDTDISNQAPIHTQSLVILGYLKKDDEEKSPGETPAEIDPIPSGKEPDRVEHAIGVVEQRASNLVQGSLCLVLMTGPFLHVLNLIPRGGYFF